MRDQDERQGAAAGLESASKLQTALHRANQLASAHANVIARSLHAIADNASLEELCGQLLQTIVSELGADSGAFWLCDESDELIARIYLAFEDGQIVKGENSSHPGREPRPIPEELASHWRQHRYDPVVYQKEDYVESATLAFCREFYLEQEVRTVVTIPLVLGERLFGTCAVRWTRRRLLDDEDLRLATALSMQATLALQLVRFAQRAREAALAEARERAAQERATELSEANRMLQDALNLLTSEPELGAFLAFVLRSVVERFRAHSSSLQVLYAEGTRILFLRNWEGGRLYSAEEYASSPLVRAYEQSADVATVRDTYERPEARVFNVESGSPWTLELFEAFRGMGVKTIANLPLMIGSRVIGRLVIRFDTVRQVGADDLQLMQSIANQVALAMHLTRLAVEGNRSAVLGERTRMARDIHDTLAQGFTGVIVQLEAAKDAIGLQRGADADAHIERAASLARLSLAEARRSVHALRPLALEHGGLSVALSTMLESMTAGTDIRGRARTEGDDYPIALDCEEDLLRIAQEALSNALRHGTPGNIEMMLRFSPTEIVLEIQDDGIGFDPDRPSDGMGLTGMQERCARIGARFDLDTMLGRGVRIRVMLALEVGRGSGIVPQT